MGYDYGGWAPYVPVAERRRKALSALAKATKSGDRLQPVAPYRGAIAKTFWGRAWSDNLEAYSDYANRLPRGRTYLRNGSVIDLRIAAGQVRAKVMGSSLYEVAVQVAAVAKGQWQAIGAECAASIDSLVELLQGKLSSAVMQRICAPRTGLFPEPREIKFSCSCPDSAALCKHVAAVLYGVGARLDQQPELLFSLRQVDAMDLVKQADSGLLKPRKGLAAGKVLADSKLAEMFGIEMDAGARAATKPAQARRSASAKKTAGKIGAPLKTLQGQAPGPGKSAQAKKVRPVKRSPAKKSTAGKAAKGKTLASASVGGKSRAKAVLPPKPAAKRTAGRRSSG